MDKHGILEMTTMRYEADRPAAANPVKIQDLSFRDGHSRSLPLVAELKNLCASLNIWIRLATIQWKSGAEQH